MSEEEMLDIIDRIIRCNSLTYFGYNTVQVGYEALEKIVKQYKEQQEQIEKQEKVIDKMAVTLEEVKICMFKKEAGGELLGKYRCFNANDWKDYFYKEIEDE